MVKRFFIYLFYMGLIVLKKYTIGRFNVIKMADFAVLASGIFFFYKAEYNLDVQL